MSIETTDEYWVPEHVREYLRRLGFHLPLDDMEGQGKRQRRQRIGARGYSARVCQRLVRVQDRACAGRFSCAPASVVAVGCRGWLPASCDGVWAAGTGRVGAPWCEAVSAPCGTFCGPSWDREGVAGGSGGQRVMCGPMRGREGRR